MCYIQLFNKTCKKRLFSDLMSSCHTLSFTLLLYLHCLAFITLPYIAFTFLAWSYLTWPTWPYLASSYLTLFTITLYYLEHCWITACLKWPLSDDFLLSYITWRLSLVLHHLTTFSCLTSPDVTLRCLDRWITLCGGGCNSQELGVVCVAQMKPGVTDVLG